MNEIVKNNSNELLQNELLNFPELIIGLVAPIGADIPLISEKVSLALETLDYNSIPIHLTKEMIRFGDPAWDLKTTGSKDIIYESKIDYANNLRDKYSNPDTMSQIAIQTIREHRKGKTNDIGKPSLKTAYLIRQLKLPEEVILLRKVYGKQFILISANGTRDERKNRLCDDIRKTVSTDKPEIDIAYSAEKLIERDASETNALGQNLTDTFHLADVFIDGINPEKMEKP